MQYENLSKLLWPQWQACSLEIAKSHKTYNRATLPYSHITPNTSSLNQRILTNMHIVSNFHRIIAKSPKTQSQSSMSTCPFFERANRTANSPFVRFVRRSDYTSSRQQRVFSYGYNDGMPSANPPQVASENTLVLYDGLAPEDNILRSVYMRQSRDFIPAFLHMGNRP